MSGLTNWFRSDGPGTLLVLTLLTNTAVGCNRSVYEDMVDLDDMFQCIKASNYSNFEAPPGVTKVTLKLFISHLSSTADRLFDFKFNIGTTWYDNRISDDIRNYDLRDSVEIFNNRYKTVVWKVEMRPATDRLKKIPGSDDERLLILNPSGNITMILFGARNVQCENDFTFYPFDKLHCTLIFYAHYYNNKWGSKHDVLPQWSDDGPLVLIDKVDHMAEFSITDMHTGRTNVDLGTKQGHKAWYAVVTLTRDSTNVIIMTYIPTSLLVIVGWTTFHVNPSSSPARACIAMITLLGNINMLSNVFEGRSVKEWSVSDIYIIVCMVFNLCVVIEFAVSDYYKQVEDGVRIAANRWMKRTKKLTNQQPLNQEHNSPSKWETLLSHDRKPISKSQKIDSWSKLLFPVAFLVFEICYWTAVGIGQANQRAREP